METLLDWNEYMNTLSREFSKKGIVKRDDIRKFLRDNGYSKAARKFIKSYSGDKTKTTPNISVNKTISRLSKKTRKNTKILKARLMEIESGNYQNAIKYINSYTKELRKRAKTISDSSELQKTKAELKRMIGINKAIREANEEDAKKIIENAFKTVNDIQFQKAVRSSASAQVKSVAVTEKSRRVAGNFYESNVKNANDETLFDIVLSHKHYVYDECDIIAKNSPYTKDNLPALPLHPNCQCRYHRHTDKTEALNNKRILDGEASDYQKEKASEAYRNKATDAFA